jgi:serine O-acetyltransferase
MPSLLRLIASDLRAKAAWNYERTGFGAVIKTLLTDGTPAMIWYRLMQWAGRWRLVPLEMAFNRLNTICCGCVIGRGAQFGPGFVLIHSLGVVINGSVRGGSGVKIEHQVTIGAERRQSPVIGDDVFIGAGAKIVGPVKVGDGARIGANAVVVHDVPPHSTVVGIPARVVRQRTAQPAGESPTSDTKDDVEPGEPAAKLD